MKPTGAVERVKRVPHPEDKPELPRKSRRRPSHFRKKRRDTTARVVHALRPAAPGANEQSHVVPRPRPRQEVWSEVINPAPALPDPLLHRPMPPPAPLPSEASNQEPTVPGWLDDRQRRKRVEDIVGTVVLAIMVAGMLVAMWLRMTGT